MFFLDMGERLASNCITFLKELYNEEENSMWEDEQLGDSSSQH